jgi:hypothetical protein
VKIGMEVFRLVKERQLVDAEEKEVLPWSPNL